MTRFEMENRHAVPGYGRRYPFLVDEFLCYFKIATCISTQPHVKSLLIKRQTTEPNKL